MDITTNLQIETRRLDILGVRFRMYEHLNREKIGIVIKSADRNDRNIKKIIEAGYVYGRASKNGEVSLYEISVSRLEEMNKYMIKLVDLECKRIETIGDITFRYKFSTDGNFVINVLENGIDDDIALKLTEMGYSSRSWTTQGNISEYTIPISELQKIHGVSSVDTSN